MTPEEIHEAWNARKEALEEYLEREKPWRTIRDEISRIVKIGAKITGRPRNPRGYVSKITLEGDLLRATWRSREWLVDGEYQWEKTDQLLIPIHWLSTEEHVWLQELQAEHDRRNVLKNLPEVSKNLRKKMHKINRENDAAG